MAELHEALATLTPTDWEDVPKDDLQDYLSKHFTSGELLCNSVPPPPEGTPFEQSAPQHNHPNLARSHKDMHPSSSRAFPPHKGHEELRSNWGKPLKFSAKENPHNIALYKMAGHDRHGAWFARRSVHEGMGFSKFRTAMLREFPETLSVQGGPGEGSIRGIGGDKRLEQKEVEGVGKVEVYQLSAQFPGPVTPREFITLLLTSQSALSAKSAAQEDTRSKHIPRHFMIVSKPVKHLDAPERAGYVRGQYESVELIREIPLHTAKSQSTPDLLSHSDAQHDSNLDFDTKSERQNLTTSRTETVPDNPELNPVEWIMITRSDPGGGIPRFMVERGTPSAMIGDVHKFLDWATSLDDDGTSKESVVSNQPAGQETIDTQHGEAGSVVETSSTSKHPDRATAHSTEEPNGIIYHLTQAVGAGLDAYAPTAVSSYVHGKSEGQEALEDSTDTSETSSMNSFASANEIHSLSTARGKHDESSENISTESVQLATGVSREGKVLSQHEKEMVKLNKERDKLDRKLTRKREEEEAKLKKAQQDEASESSKAKERFEKEIKRQEDKHKKEIEKLQSKKDREHKKAEEKRRKQNDRDNLSKVARERDEFRSQSDLLKRENALLREQLGDLQKENTAMANRLGKLGGPDTLRNVREELGAHRRSVSSTSVKTQGSSQSKET